MTEELSKLKEITVVVPVLNEELLINELINRLDNSLSSITDNYEILVVDDGSSDGTWNSLKQIAIKNQNLKAIRFSRNF